LGLGAAAVAPEPVLTMANFAGYKPIPVARWGSQVEWDDPTRLPLGIAMVVRNCQYLAESVKTRYGLQRTINGASAVTGLAMLKYTGSPAVKIPLIFSTDGSFVYESPLGSGTKVAIADGFGLLNAGTNAQMEPAYDNIYLAFSDLVEGKYKPAVFNGGTKVLDPLSEKPIGITWSLTTKFRVGQVVTPTVPNGHLYRCSAVALDQLSGAVEPVWPLTDAGVIVDNNVTWTEITPGMAIVFPTPSAPALTRVAAVGNFAAGRDVYIRITLTNDFELDGETNMSPAASLIATVLHDAVQVTPPTVPGWLSALPAPYQITGYNIYEADVATGAPAPDVALYKKSNEWGIAAPGVPGLQRAANVVTVTTVSPHGLVVGKKATVRGATDATYNGSGFVILSTPSATTATWAQVGPNSTSGDGSITTPELLNVPGVQGQTSVIGGVGPTVNTAYVTPVGNICSGLRWMIVLYKNRNGYISGCSDPVPVSFDMPTDGLSLRVHDVPIGPANTADRVCAFTVAGDNRAGRYFFIPEDDSVAASDLNSNATGDGITMTKTVIEDNVTTTAVFNFVDFYLLQSEEVTEFFRKIEVPECSDIHFSKALNRVVYAGILGAPSSCYVSDPADPETVLLPGAEVIAAEKSGGRVVCWKEFREIQYILKEDSGHVVTPNSPQPSLWPVRDAWTGSGPCGPRAVAVTNSFMLWAHRTGLWKYDGSDPVKVSPELVNTWKRINWAQKTENLDSHRRDRARSLDRRALGRSRGLHPPHPAELFHGVGRSGGLLGTPGEDDPQRQWAQVVARPADHQPDDHRRARSRSIGEPGDR
jgi:hypothetical protein